MPKQPTGQQIQKSLELAEGEKTPLLRITRENGKTKLFLKILPEMEEIFKSEDVQESRVYGVDGQNHRFYEKTENEDNLRNLMRGECAIRLNDYGTRLIDGNGYFNLSIFRTVGLSEGKYFDVESLISEEMLLDYAKAVKNFCVKLYKNYIRKVEINVTFDVKEVC